MRWVKVVEMERVPALALVAAADVARAGWVAPRLLDRAGTVSAPVADIAKCTRQACPATGKSAPSVAHR